MIKTNISRHLMNTAVFAAAGAATGAATANKTAGAPKGKRGPPPVQTDVANDIPIPDNVRGSRGSKSQYKFAELTSPGMSFGITGKTAHQMSSVISNQNKKPGTTQATNPDGSLKFEPMKDANGAVIGVSTTPVMLPGPQFVCADVKEAKGVTARVWRKS